MRTVLAFTFGVVAMVSLFLWVQTIPYEREIVILTSQGCDASTALGRPTTVLPGGQCKLVGRTHWSMKVVSIDNIDIDRSQVVASMTDKTGEARDQVIVLYGLMGFAVLLGAAYLYREYRNNKSGTFNA